VRGKRPLFAESPAFFRVLRLEGAAQYLFRSRVMLPPLEMDC